MIRGDDLCKSMSSYLARRIETTDNIELLRNTDVARMDGDGHLSQVEVRDRKSDRRRTVETPAVFCFIGATPRTSWLPPEVAADDKGFILTGRTVAGHPAWRGRREPFLLETSRPGVFAAGDVRRDSIKRVASAVGEGAMAVHFVHQYLATL